VTWVDQFDDVELAEDTGEVVGGGVIVQLGNIQFESGTRALVPGSIYARARTTGGAMYVVEKRARMWAVTGTRGDTGARSEPATAPPRHEQSFIVRRREVGYARVDDASRAMCAIVLPMLFMGCSAGKDTSKHATLSLDCVAIRAVDRWRVLDPTTSLSTRRIERRPTWWSWVCIVNAWPRIPNTSASPHTKKAVCAPTARTPCWSTTSVARSAPSCPTRRATSGLRPAEIGKSASQTKARPRLLLTKARPRLASRRALS